MTLPRTPSFRLDGQHALVTGASSGIGRASAVALAEAGARVTCVARGADLLRETVDEMRAAGWQVEALALDVTDIAEVRNAISAMPSLDVMVNSAGLARHSPALSTTPEDFDAVMNVNLRAAYFLSAAAAAKMAGKGGSIVHISSQMGHVGGIDRAVYSASKHGLEGMVKSMAIEWGPDNIRINTLCPTFIRTPLTVQTFDDPDRAAWVRSKIKLGRIGELEDIMGAVVYLASRASSLVTGTSLMVDGGWTAD